MSKNMFYPPIENLFKRDPVTHKLIEGEYKCPEFKIPHTWLVTEKIHGINICVTYAGNEVIGPPVVRFNGRSVGSIVPEPVLEVLGKIFTPESCKKATTPELDDFHIRYFMEAYGPRIQKGGGNYRKDITVRLFDAWIQDNENPLGGWWLSPNTVRDIARALEIKAVPILGYHMTVNEVVAWVKSPHFTSTVAVLENPRSRTGYGGRYIPPHMAEGVVARTVPMLFTRRGKRLIWKLKRKDFILSGYGEK